MRARNVDAIDSPSDGEGDGVGSWSLGGGVNSGGEEKATHDAGWVGEAKEETDGAKFEADRNF
jgi:hypothetical protein